MSKFVKINELPTISTLNSNDLIVVTIDDESRYVTAENLSSVFNIKSISDINLIISQLNTINSQLNTLSSNEIILSNNLESFEDSVEELNPTMLDNKYDLRYNTLSSLSTEYNNILNILTSNINILESNIENINKIILNNNLLFTEEYINNISTNYIYLSVLAHNNDASLYDGVLYKINITQTPPFINVVSSENVKNPILKNFNLTCEELSTNYSTISDEYNWSKNLSSELSVNTQKVLNIINILSTSISSINNL